MSSQIWTAPGTRPITRLAAQTGCGRWPTAIELTGFTHYVGAENDGWLTSEEADELLTVAGERRLLFSLAASPLWQEDLRVLARRHPDVPILCHHLGGASAGADPALLRTLLDSVSCPNIYIKASGFHYASSRGWDYPWTRRHRSVPADL